MFDFIYEILYSIPYILCTIIGVQTLPNTPTKKGSDPLPFNHITTTTRTQYNHNRHSTKLHCTTTTTTTTTTTNANILALSTTTTTATTQHNTTISTYSPALSTTARSTN